MRTRYYAIGVVTAAAMLVLWGILGKKLAPRYSLSVSFAGYTNLDVSFSGEARFAKRFGMPPEPGLHNYGKCVMLAVTNNDRRRLQFHSRAVEYETNGHWREVHPQRWAGVQGWRWLPGAAATVAVSVPPEVPAGAKWRIRLACALAAGGPRQKLNDVARRYFGPDSLAFYSPAAMWTADIPPQEPNPAVQRTGASRSGRSKNRASSAVGSGR